GVALAVFLLPTGNSRDNNNSNRHRLMAENKRTPYPQASIPRSGYTAAPGPASSWHTCRIEVRAGYVPWREMGKRARLAPGFAWSVQQGLLRFGRLFQPDPFCCLC
ncbi:MAG: hypothetical protein ACYCPA_14030, partial [Acidithiobacillus sp.]